MKKRLSKRLAVCLTIILIALNTNTVFADAPYRTLTQGPSGRLVGTQTAYEPSEILTFPLKNPEDIYVDDNTGTMYIADTGNSRILVVNDKKETKSIGEDVLESPSGVFMNSEGNLYVADYGKKKIFIFDKDGKLLKEIGKPAEPIYGKNNGFVPKKLTVDKRNNIYVISEGSVNGVIQLNNEGKFTGFIGSNKTDLSFKMILQRLVFTDKQKAQLFKVIPPSPTSISIDTQGLIYTVTSGVKSEGVKKLNITGINILPAETKSSDTLIDIDVDKDGNIYALDINGKIYEYDSTGNLLFAFGGKDAEQERVGLLKNPAAIAVTDKGYIYVVDKERNVINVYKATAFANQVMKGVNLYKDGLYVESQKTWQDILKMNSSFILSYKALAKAYFKQDNYQIALNDFKLAEDQKGYSEAFWQIRNQWIQENMPKILLLLVLILVLRFVIKLINKKTKLFNGITRQIDRFKNIKVVAELRFVFRFFKLPADSYYELKYSKRASVLSATILYIWFLILQFTNIYVTGFTFSKINPAYVNLTSVVVNAFVPFALWIIANYLVSTINDGEGRLRDIYIGTIYSLAPYLVIVLPVQIISNALTLNEAFIYTFSLFVTKAWSVILIVVMVKEIHNYTFKETVKNILLTVFTIILIVLVLFILVILFNQEVDFVKSIIQELRIRV